MTEWGTPVISRTLATVLAGIVILACGSSTTKAPAQLDTGGAAEGLSPDSAGSGTDLGGVGPFDLKPKPRAPDVVEVGEDLEVAAPDLPDLVDGGPDLAEVEADVPSPLCDSDQWCVDQFGPGVYCRQSDGQCLPVAVPDCGWCGAACDHDDACIALSPTPLCDQETALCYEAKPLGCSLNRDCEFMGPEYECNVKNRCLILPSAEEGCQSKEDCPVELRVTICHDSVDPGACAPPCDNDESCEPLEAGLACKTDNGKYQ